MAKANITRTLGPIHFEDLDPHRFEDLVRQLAYDYRQWQSIESTGRGGADDGFDVRAYEIQAAASVQAEDDEEPGEPPHPMEGNLWMIQCKRERQLGPKRVAAIIHDAVDPAKPPYGYILAAAAHFSKQAHDKFRDELRSRGVMEFYLWGAGELEDMLYQPKNDHILFVFFGISFATRRRSRTTEIRAAVASKNKLLRILGEQPEHRKVLLRDLSDVEYPYQDHYRDFVTQPRWNQFSAVEFHPLGLVVAVARCYAYFDKAKRKWDYTKTVNNATIDQSERRYGIVKPDNLKNSVNWFWEHLPIANRATYVRNGLISFASMALIDEHGDSEFDCPHIFVDFKSGLGPFLGNFEFLELRKDQIEYLDDLKRVTVFPETFPKPAFGTIFKDKLIALDARTQASLKHHMGDVTVYDADENYEYLKPQDVIGINVQDTQGKSTLLRVTHVEVVTGEQLIAKYQDDALKKRGMEDQIGRPLTAKDRIRVIEARVIYDWQIEQNRPVA